MLNDWVTYLSKRHKVDDLREKLDEIAKEVGVWPIPALKSAAFGRFQGFIADQHYKEDQKTAKEAYSTFNENWKPEGFSSGDDDELDEDNNLDDGDGSYQEESESNSEEELQHDEEYKSADNADSRSGGKDSAGRVNVNDGSGSDSGDD